MKLFRPFLTRIRSSTIRRRYSPNIGANARFVSPVNVLVDGPVRIGKDFFAGPGFYASTNPYCSLKIGDATMFGPRVMILGGNHDYTFTGQHLRYHSDHNPNTKDIVIENGVWVGANSVILSGTHIGEGTIVGAQSLVNCPLPPYCIAVGQPAKAIKSRFQTIQQLRDALKNTNSSLRYSDVIELYSSHSISFPTEV